MPSEDGHPLASVLIPSFNHERFVEEAVQSVLQQTYPAVELVIVDDCSSDRTPQIIEKLASEHRITFVRNETNQGVNRTLETAFSLCTGDFVSVLASDDRLVPTKIEDQVEFLRRSGFDAVYGTCWSLFADGRTEFVDLGDLEEEFRTGAALKRLYTEGSNAPLLQSALMSRSCFSELSPERSRFKSDDWVMLIRLAERYRVGFANKPQFYYRQHEGNTYTDSWATVPGRMEVISSVTPEPLRALAIGNMFLDHAQFLYLKGRRGTALKFLLASMALNPSMRSWIRLVTSLTKRAARKTFR